MKSIYTYILLGLVAFFSLELSAQERFESITIPQKRIEVKDSILSIKMEIDINRLHLKSNQGIWLIPSIQSNAQSMDLPPIIINGRNRQISYARTIGKKNSITADNTPYMILRNDKKGKRIILYNLSIPFENWMENSTLVLNEDVCGCRNVIQNIDSRVIARNIQAPTPFFPKLSTLFPTSESLKSVSDTILVEVYFPNNGDYIIPDYKENRENLEKIRTSTYNDKNGDITIIGAASPLGSWAYNESLSQKRAYNLASYLTEQYNISISSERIKWVGEDWNALLKLVEQSQMTDKQEVIDIITGVEDIAQRKNELAALQSGIPYKYLLYHLYPKLRNASYVVYVPQKTFDVEKGKKVIRNTPNALTADEMLLIARSYAPDSKEYMQTLMIAQQTYPNHVMIGVDLSSALIAAGNITAAKKVLNRFEKNSAAWNNLGVIYLMEGNYDQARKYFRKAIDFGNADAQYNINGLKQLIRE